MRQNKKLNKIVLLFQMLLKYLALQNSDPHLLFVWTNENFMYLELVSLRTSMLTHCMTIILGEYAELYPKQRQQRFSTALYLSLGILYRHVEIHVFVHSKLLPTSDISFYHFILSKSFHSMLSFLFYFSFVQNKCHF